MKVKFPAGFTLTELIVAMGVAMVLVLGLVSLMGQGTESYRRVVDKVSEQGEARAALHYIANDASTLLPSQEVSVGIGGEGQGWGFREGRYEEWSYSGEGIERERGGWISDRIGFYLTLSPREQPRLGEAENLGDIAHVLYFTKVTPDDPEQPDGARSRKLFRMLSGSDRVLSAVADEDYLGRGVDDEERGEILAYNVVQLEAVLLVTLETVGGHGEVTRKLLRWNEEGRAELAREVSPVASGDLNDPAAPAALPGESQVWATAVELEITLASDSAAQALAQDGWDQSARSAELLAEKQLSTFHMRVPLADF